MNSRHKPWRFALSLLLLVVVLLTGCGPRNVAQNLLAPPRPKPGETKESAHLEGAKLVYKDPHGNTLWTVTAKEGSGEMESMTAELKEVKCIFYADDRPSWVCRADTLTARQPTKEVTLEGNVTGNSSDGERSFTAPSAKWDIQSERITGGPGVTFRLGKLEFTGDRLIASTKDKKGRVFGHVRGRFLDASSAKLPSPSSPPSSR